MDEKILIVDDEPNVLSSLRRQLRNEFDLHVASGGEEALEIVRRDGPFAVVLSDMRMPGMSGTELLSRLSEIAPETVRMMLTGNADQETAVSAINRGGIFRFFNKPVHHEEVSAGLHAALRQYRLVVAERQLLEGTVTGSMRLITDVLMLIDPRSFGIRAVVGDWAARIADQVDLDVNWKLNLAASISSIGTAAIPAAIRTKINSGVALEDSEQQLVDAIPALAKRMISRVPRLQDVAKIVYFANKGYDGSGQPKEPIAGEDLPIESRILKILNDVAQLTRGKAPAYSLFADPRFNRDLYDPKLLAIIQNVIGRESGEPYPDNAVSRGQSLSADEIEIAPDEIRAGIILKSDLMFANGTLALAAGMEITPAQMELLKFNRGIRDVVRPIIVDRLTYECLIADDVDKADHVGVSKTPHSPQSALDAR